MEQGLEVTIKIGETKTITANNQECSVTEYWLNDGEKREAVICPTRYATDFQLMHVISKDIIETFKSE
jgi:hypothetical protein